MNDRAGEIVYVYLGRAPRSDWDKRIAEQVERAVSALCRDNTVLPFSDIVRVSINTGLDEPFLHDVRRSMLDVILRKF